MNPLPAQAAAAGPGAPVDPAGELPAELAAVHERLVAGAADVLPPGGLAAKLLTARREGRPLRVKLGIDPSGSELTLGHAVVLRKLRQFQDAGHLAVLIVGDFTGRVGDPSGRTATRSALTAEQTAENARTYVTQLMRVLDPDRVEVRYNSQWLAGLAMADVLRNAAVLTVAQLLERDDFARRFRAGAPISLMEFLYPMLQGLDSAYVQADVELGGTDQTYNNLVGREIQRAHGQPPQVVLTVPLLVGLDGVEKMSKSLGNYVAIDEPAAEQFGKLLSIPDALVPMYARLCTDLPLRVLDDVESAVAGGGPPAAEAKRTVARAVVTLYHGAAAAVAAEARFDRVFRRHEAPADLPVHPLGDGDPVHLPALLRDAGLAASTSEGRRLLAQGAVRLGGEQVPAQVLEQPRARLVGQVLAVGRRRMVRLVDR